MAKESQAENPLDKIGFHLLKPGKQIVVGGRQFIRAKDVEIVKDGKKIVEKNIKKISYVPNVFIKANNIDLKHFEPGNMDEIQKIYHENIKSMNDRLAKV